MTISEFYEKILKSVLLFNRQFFHEKILKSILLFNRQFYSQQ